MAEAKNLRTILLLSAVTVACLGQTPSARAGEPATRSSKTTQPSQAGPAAFLDRLKSAVMGLGLDADQKAKIKPLFEEAGKDLQVATEETDEKARTEKVHAVLNALRKSVGAELTNEQKLELQKKMQPAGPGATIDRIKEQLNNPALKLSEDQKTKAGEILDDTKKKLEDLREQYRAGKEKNIGPRITEILHDMHDKLALVLSSDQREHLNLKPAGQ